jgi:hypothetical protein
VAQLFSLGHFALMKKWHVIVFIVLPGLLLIAALILPSLSHGYSGPGIHGDLITLEVAKAQWEADHKGVDAWLTKRDMLPYLTRDTHWTSFEQAIRTSRDVVYIINKTGAPVYAYEPKSERLFCVDSNDLQRYLGR